MLTDPCCAVLCCAGAGLGGLVGGLLYGSLGATALFRTTALTLATGWLGAALVLRIWGGSHGSGAGAGASGVGCVLLGSASDAPARPQRQRELKASSEEGEDAALLLR